MDRIKIRTDLTPSIIRMATSMLQVDPVSAMKHITAPADWGQVNALAAYVADGVYTTPGIDEASAKEETQARLAAIFYKATGTAPEGAGGVVASAPPQPSTAAPEARADAERLASAPQVIVRPSPGVGQGSRMKASDFLLRSATPTSRKEYLKQKALDFLGIFR